MKTTSDERIEKELEIAKKLANTISQLVIARNNKGITQQELAEMCGLKQSAIARMEKLQVIPRIDTIIRVSTYLGIELKIEEELARWSFIDNNYNKYTTYTPQQGCYYSRGALCQ